MKMINGVWRGRSNNLPAAWRQLTGRGTGAFHAAPASAVASGMPARLGDIFDQVADLIDRNQLETGLTLLAGVLLTLDDVGFAQPLLRQHRLHSILLEDPYSARAFDKPRGYAGDAVVMDLIYDQLVPDGTSERGRDIFAITTAFPAAQAVRERRRISADFVAAALARNERICSLACGHMRELDLLTHTNLMNITAVDQDALSIAYVRQGYPAVRDARNLNVFEFLRRAISSGERYDLIYTLGFTDYCDQRTMYVLIKLMKRCLNDGGTIIVANFTPDHLARGWLEICLDWHLTYRDESVMSSHAERHSLTADLWRDDTQSILFSRMQRAA